MSVPSGRVTRLCVVLAGLAAACDGGRTEPSAQPAPAPSLAAPPAPSAGGKARGPEGCRALSVDGSVAFASGAPVQRGAWLSARWIDLGEGARVHLKHGASGREWTLDGPARAQVCAGGREEIALGGGTLKSELGAGARPGAEVLVGTPFGTLRYSHARAEIQVSERELWATVAAGQMWFVNTASAEADVAVGLTKPIRRSAQHTPSAEAALAACEGAARTAESETKALLAPGLRATGARAAAQVRARRRAGSVCLSARALLLQAASGPELSRELARVDRYRELSLRIPEIR